MPSPIRGTEVFRDFMCIRCQMPEENYRRISDGGILEFR
jgi:hypothetical protein